jgi:tyrosine-protein phosphatase SIW14
MKPSRLFHSLAFVALMFTPAPALADPTATGVPNFHQVNDHVYRGGQPDPSGWTSLAELGVKTVIDLRLEREHSTAAEAQAVQAAGMRYVSIPMDGFETPTPGTINRVLALLESGPPVFIHCRQGRDRTGTAVAAYRIAHDRWTCERALQEAVSTGLHWYERGMKRFILGYQPPADLFAATPRAPASRDSALANQVPAAAAPDSALGRR